MKFWNLGPKTTLHNMAIGQVSNILILTTGCVAVQVWNEISSLTNTLNTLSPNKLLQFTVQCPSMKLR